MKYLVLFIGLFIMPHNVLSQKVGSSDNGDEYEGKSYLMLGVNYLSDNVYLGRKDSVQVPYFSPYIGYQWRSGIYLKAMASFTSQPSTHLDCFTLTGGYQHQFGDYFYTGAQYDKYFYNKNTVSIRSNIKSSVEAFGMFVNDYIEPTIIGDLNFTKAGNIDYVLGGSLDHNFDLVDNKLSIAPTVTMYSGTQNYYEEYKQALENKKGKVAKRPKIVNSATQFEVLDYEISVQVYYYIHHWAFKLIPAYAIPLNPSTLTINNMILPEKINNTFFLELDICYRN